ncbi:helix-turn-helix transcriptional regulator [Paenibacillus ginsengihumi]|uniref:helix-turn-helix transcriptional regulator n=1 Tax=Paenibacillus ginsengihumi TaxID=431596 RepID=UPI0003696340|nr:YafY family protein [Paenibacillus ginsengihumi]
MRLDRLLGITLELMARKRVTAAELAANEVSVRTIYRDVELINQAGIPVASFTGADGGFELMNGFFLTRQHFSADDLSIIYTLLKAMEGAMGGPAATAMRKLASLHPALANEGSREVVLDMTAPERDRDIVHRLFQAIRQSRVAEIVYMSASGTQSERRVEPLNLLWEKGVWYLEAYCLQHQAKRYFRVSRIVRLDVAETTFAPRRFPDEPEQGAASGIQAHLRFDLSASMRVLEQFPGECTVQGDRIDVHTTFYTKEYALSVIVSYGTKVDIVSPVELRNDVIDHIEAIRRHYGSKQEEGAT